MVLIKIVGKPGCADVLAAVNGVEEVFPERPSADTYVSKVSDLSKVRAGLERLRSEQGYHFVVDAVLGSSFAGEKPSQA